MEVYRKMATNPKFKARRGVEIRKCLRGKKKKKPKLVWKDEQEFDRKIRGHIPVRGNSVSKHKNMQKCVLRLESQNHLAEAQGK